MKTGYILGLSRGHNAGACLVKDGEIIFALEEERLSRQKYDGSPLALFNKVLEYTDKVDYIIISHTTPLGDTAPKIEYTGDDVYSGLARKLGLIDRKPDNLYDHPQVIDASHLHHKIHAACAFYRSGWEDAAALVVDGAGAAISSQFAGNSVLLWETESIYDCSYENGIKTLYKHLGTRDHVNNAIVPDYPTANFGEEGTMEAWITGNAGIVKVYEAVTEYCGFPGIEAGKTMGLFPYGKKNTSIPDLYIQNQKYPTSSRDVVTPMYPNSAMINHSAYSSLDMSMIDLENLDNDDITKLQNRRDLAYQVQTQSQEQVLKLIYKTVEMTGKKRVVISGGYALNCVANYFYLDKLKEDGIEIFVEPISNDGGTAIGAALLYYYENTFNDSTPMKPEIYLGPSYTYSESDIENLANKFNATIEDADDDKVVDLMTSKNIVSVFQGRSENGPRALGNRSLLFDPTFEDGKDFVNKVKRREYFRPFAGSILQEDVHDWFDLRGMDESPHMMYAVHCKEGVAEKIPSIIHVDGSCRIQTVKEEDNPLYYKLIKAFKEKTGVPIVFNTSFNLGGEPLVETLEDALWTLQQSEIEYLYLPEYKKLLKILNWSAV